MKSDVANFFNTWWWRLCCGSLSAFLLAFESSCFSKGETLFSVISSLCPCTAEKTRLTTSFSLMKLLRESKKEVILDWLGWLPAFNKATFFLVARDQSTWHCRLLSILGKNSTLSLFPLKMMFPPPPLEEGKAENAESFEDCFGCHQEQLHQ